MHKTNQMCYRLSITSWTSLKQVGSSLNSIKPLEKTFHLEYWLNLQYLSQSRSGISALSSSKMGGELRLTNKLNLQKRDALRARCGDFNIAEIVAASTKYLKKKKNIHHKMLSKNLFIHLLFKVKPVSQRAKRQHLPPPTWKLKRISMPRPMSHPTGRKESVFLPDACMSARASRSQTAALWLCSHSLTSQISESSGGSFLSWRRRAKTCSEWTLLSVRRLTSFISIRGNIRWSWGDIYTRLR